MAGRRRSPGPIHSKAQQAYLWGVYLKKHPNARGWINRWSHQAGETGHRTPSSRAAYAALPRRKGTRRR